MNNSNPLATTCTKTGIVGKHVRGGDSLLQNNSSSNLQDNWRARNNEKPLTVKRRKLY